MDVELKSKKKSATDAKHKVIKPILKRSSPPSTPTPDDVMVTPSKARSPNHGVIFNPLVAVFEFNTNEPTTKFDMHEVLIELCCYNEHQDNLLDNNIVKPNIVQLTGNINTVISSTEEKLLFNNENVFGGTSPSFNKKNKSNNKTTTGVTTPKRASKISGNVDINQEESNNDPPLDLQAKEGSISETVPVEDVTKISSEKEKIIPKNINEQSENSEEPAPVVNQIQNMISTLLTNEKTDRQQFLESVLDVLTDELSQGKTDADELQTTKEKLMLQLLGSEEGSSSSVKEKESDALSSQANVECDPRANIVAGINKLHFMGEPLECKWETLTGDNWSFLLLHERVRLIVRLERRDDDEELSDVPGSWPLTRVALDLMPGDMENWMRMCVPHAMEAMRAYFPGVEEIHAVPELLERCAAVARLANGWIRAVNMPCYNLDYKGAPHQLVFKVANHSFNCEWTVTLAIKMKVIKQSRDRFPFVDHVKVTSGTQVRDAPDPTETRRLKKIWGHVPLNWDHVPKTLWRIYKYLKNIQKRPNSSI